MTELRFLPGLLNALRRCDTLDKVYRRRRPIHCGDETCTDDHG